MTQISENLFVLDGAVNTGVLRAGNRALLVDCCDSVTPERLASLGIDTVDLICCTQPRRQNMAGVYPFVQQGAGLVAAADDRTLYEAPHMYWENWTRRWVGSVSREGRTYLSLQPQPEVPVYPVPVAHPMSDGQSLDWQGYRIHVLRLQPIWGSLAFVIDIDGRRVCFSGDYLYGAGRFWEVYPFQETYGDSHGFTGENPALLRSLERIAHTQADVIIPAHGMPFEDVQHAVQQTTHAVREVAACYRDIGAGGAEYLCDAPPHVLRIPKSTSHAVVAANGSALLVDLGDDCAVWEVAALQQQGVISSVEAVYVTHFHGDHHWALNHLLYYFPDCQVIADVHQADILRHPARYASRLINSRPIPVHRSVTEGECWQWKEYTLTNFHFPSHTYYHGALLVEGHDQRLLFTGDSMAQGLSMGEYCAHNRTFIGEKAGGLKCLQVLDDTQPDLLFCGHADQPSYWTPALLEKKRAAYRRRAEIFASLTPHAHPNFALDPEWVTTYPYEQDAAAGATCRVDAVFTNHGADPAVAEIDLMLPDGWEQVEMNAQHPTTTTVEGSGTGAITRWFRIPHDAAPGVYVLPLRVTWDQRYLGQFRHALVHVW